MVAEEAEFRGKGYVFNWPGRWSRQTDEDGWQNRIRSIRAGTTATMTAYTGADFKGRSIRFLPGTAHPRLESAFSGHIESLEITCRQ